MIFLYREIYIRPMQSGYSIEFCPRIFTRLSDAVNWIDEGYKVNSYQ